MKLAVISHKVCWHSSDSPSGFITDGGFPQQIGAISELFDETKVVVPCRTGGNTSGLSPLVGNALSVVPLSEPKGKGLRRKLNMPLWLFRNCFTIFRECLKADAIHSPIPGDVGTIGMVFAMLFRKPLFVRHCGNWLVQRTMAERFWRWSMEYFAGGRNVMLATGGADRPPSEKNPNVEWIFATSLRKTEIETNAPRELPKGSPIKLIIVCRQEERKGTDVVIDSLPLVLEKLPNVTLDVVGGGSKLDLFQKQAMANSVADRVTFHGKVTHAQVIELLKASHLFCYPTSASEGFPKVVLEAMAIGLPVITTPVSVLPHLIGSSNGILLKEPAPKELANAVIGLCSDPARYRSLSASAIETAKSFSLESWRERIRRKLVETWKVDSLSRPRVRQSSAASGNV
ncbi:MAG: glycosyltransferase [Acidobacteria bacterium ACB1]|nr:Glycosyltransferase Gtf1 [Pyrinomonadaceae bacterium]MCE7962961.1 glycosyltransferase [Acidobacteria bacterium ACB1]